MNSIFICTVRYSDNLGDGVIGDCVEFLLKRISSEFEIKHIDMAGRMSYPFHSSSNKTLFKNIMYRTPVALRPLLTLMYWRTFGEKKVDGAWLSANVPRGSLIVFGGGQIISDVALNFPLKFSKIIRLGKESDCKFIVSGVGVSAKWSSLGRRIFEKAFQLGKFYGYSFRDANSYENFRNYINPAISPDAITLDPALFASEVYARNLNSPTATRLIGVGVAHPLELATQAENPEDFSIEKFVNFYRQLSVLLVNAGYSVVFFTNGSFEDEEFLGLLKDRLSNIDALARPNNPSELFYNLSGFVGVICYRLHAAIVSYSLNTPCLALVWDSKVRDFYKAIGRQQHCLDSSAEPEAVFRAFQSCMDDPIDLKVKTELKKKVESDLYSMVLKVMNPE